MLWRTEALKLVLTVIRHLRCADHVWTHGYEASTSGNVQVRRVVKHCLLERLLPCCRYRTELVVGEANVETGLLTRLLLHRAWLYRRARDAHEGLTFKGR